MKIRIKIMSLDFDNITLNEAVDIATTYIEDKRKCRVVTPNSEIAYSCKYDEKLKNIINESQLILPDGVGVIIASKILKVPLKEKVAGIEFAQALCDKLKDTNKTLFLYGGKPEIAKMAAENLKKTYPGLNIVGVCDGYVEESIAIDKIIESKADVLFVGLGSPKQEYFISNNLDRLPSYMAIGIGGALDIFAGVSKRAPEIFIKLGLEWLYRLIKEPRRIGRMMKLPLYILDVFCYKFRRN